MESVFNKMLPTVWNKIEHLEKKYRMPVTLYYTPYARKVFYGKTREGPASNRGEILVPIYLTRKFDAIIEAVPLEATGVELRVNISRFPDFLCMSVRGEISGRDWRDVQLVTKQFIDSAKYPIADDHFVEQIKAKIRELVKE